MARTRTFVGLLGLMTVLAALALAGLTPPAL
jgi:hypothetical protein